VVDPAEIEDDLVGAVTEVLTSVCARLYGRRPARTRAIPALRCAQKPVETS
jgi:predicted site-specific integrase-resolvase